MSKRNQKKFVWLNQKAKREREGQAVRKRERESGRQGARQRGRGTSICNNQCKNRAYSSSLSRVAETKIRQEE